MPVWPISTSGSATSSGAACSRPGARGTASGTRPGAAGRRSGGVARARGAWHRRRGEPRHGLGRRDAGADRPDPPDRRRVPSPGRAPGRAPGRCPVPRRLDDQGGRPAGRRRNCRSLAGGRADRHLRRAADDRADPLLGETTGRFALHLAFGAGAGGIRFRWRWPAHRSVARSASIRWRCRSARWSRMARSTPAVRSSGSRAGCRSMCRGGVRRDPCPQSVRHRLADGPRGRRPRRAGRDAAAARRERIRRASGACGDRGTPLPLSPADAP